MLPESTDDKVHVYFAYAGEKILKDVPLQVISGKQARHPLLDHRKAHGPRKGIKRKTIPEAIQKFLGIFPQGFSDLKYLKKERDYKVSAHNLMIEQLGPEPFGELLAANKFEEATTRALRVVNATNLIFPNEKMALREGLRSNDAKRRFVLSLHELLYGTSDAESRFTGWAKILFDLEAPKWTNASYFQFLAHPATYVFLKPTVTQDAADVCNFEINYRPELNWLTYELVQRFAEVLRAEIAHLKPRDMIDVQSFIWCIAPGKYE